MAGTLVANTINTDTGLFATNNAYLGIAKAWVNYNGVSQTISNSWNVSSVTYNSTGNYTINFSVAMSNATYVMAGSSGSVGNYPASLGVLSQTTTACGVYSDQHNAGAVDRTFVMATFFGN